MTRNRKIFFLIGLVLTLAVIMPLSANATAVQQWWPGSGGSSNISNFSGEYPPCMVNCPSFKPAWNSQTNRNPTNKQCTKNCMFIPDDRGYRYKQLAGVILSWIILNIIAAAFVAKVPELARKLSTWNSYSAMKIGGASRGQGDASAEVSHPGHLFSPDPAKPGGIVLLADQASRMGKKIWTYDPASGKFTSQNMPSIFQTGPLKRPEETPLTKVAKKVNEAFFPDTPLETANSTDMSNIEIQSRQMSFSRGQIMDAVRKLMDPSMGRIKPDMNYSAIRAEVINYLKSQQKPDSR